MMTREIVHRLLYAALIEIRTKAYSTQQQHIFLIADLFHNIPLQLDRASQGEISYDDILAWLRDRVRDRGGEEWFNKVVEETKQ